MKNAAFTWVYNDMVALELWCKYYSRYFEDLLVLCCGTKDEYAQTLDGFKDKYNLDRVYLEANEYDTVAANEIIKKKQRELLENHRWVLYSNCDELVITDPDYYKDLGEFMKKSRKTWVYCLGYEVLQDVGETFIDYNKPILKQRISWIKNPYNNKVLIAKKPLNWNEGQQQSEETLGYPIDSMVNQGLILLHLKHMDFDAPNRDLIPNKRGRYGYVEQKFASRDKMPEWVREVI